MLLGPFCQSPLESDVFLQSFALDPFMTHDLISLCEERAVKIFGLGLFGGSCHGVGKVDTRGQGFNNQMLAQR